MITRSRRPGRARLPSLSTALALWLILGGCGAVASGSRGSNAPIAREEWVGVSGITTIWDAIERLRPQWVPRVSGGVVNGEVVDIEALARQPLGRAVELRPLDQAEIIRYGVSAAGSTIWIEMVMR